MLFKKNAERLKVINPKIPKFYIKPKIHKENNPGDLSLTQSIVTPLKFHASSFDYHLQAFVKEIPSYTKDTNDFVNKINNFKALENSFLVILDVKALYTNKPNNEGIAAFKRKQGNDTKKTVATKVITTFYWNNMRPYIHKHIHV